MGPVRLLVIDTSSVVSAALLDVVEDGSGASVAFSFLGDDTHRHAEDLTPAVRSGLAQAGWERPDAILVGDGPGPFTGLRVGLATAATLGFAWGIPVHGICSLDGLAHQAAALAEGDFAAALDARRKELYWARYNQAGERIEGPFVGAPAALPAGLPIAGAGAAARAEELAHQGTPVLSGTQDWPVDAAQLGLAWLAAGRPQEAPQARYLRDSDAVVPGSMAGVDLSAAKRAQA